MPKAWKLSTDDVKEMIRLYRAGSSLAVIGARFQVSRQAVHHQLKQVGLNRRTMKAAQHLRSKRVEQEKRKLKRSRRTSG